MPTFQMPLKSDPQVRQFRNSPLFCAVDMEDGNLPPMEQVLVLDLCKATRPKLIWEFGTFKGMTTLSFAMTCPDAEIWTIDLPFENRGSNDTNCERATTVKDVVFFGRYESIQIHPVYADSKEFDFKPWWGKADFVFIDGGHDFDTVQRDTKTALKLCPNGIIVWHDYLNPDTPAVTYVLESLVVAGFPVRSIQETRIAFLDRSKQ